jgi:hypothetical protein
VADAIGTGIKLSSGTGCACCDDYEQVKVWSSVDQQAMLSRNPGLNERRTVEERKILMASVCPLTPNPCRPDSASSGCRPAASALTLLLSTIYCAAWTPHAPPLHDVYYAQVAHAAISSSLRLMRFGFACPGWIAQAPGFSAFLGDLSGDQISKHGVYQLRVPSFGLDRPR